MRDERTSRRLTDHARDRSGAQASNGRRATGQPGEAQPQPDGEPSTRADDTTGEHATENSLGLRVERLGPASHVLTPRQLRRALLVATLVALLVGGAINWPTLATLGAQAIGRAHDALVPPTPAPRVWRPISPSYTQSVVFGVNAPLTGYLCGAAGSATSATATPTSLGATPPKGGALGTAGPPSGDDQRPITLGVSSDAGRAWRTQATPAHGSGCAVSVNPTNARDIVLLSFICALCDATQVRTLVWRSRDAGHSWGAIAPPADVAAGSGAQPTVWPLYIASLVWAGDALYLYAIPGVTGSARLAVCLRAEACVWVDLTRALAGEPTGQVINPVNIEGMGNTLYLQLTSQQRCPTACAPDAVTRDGGATWAPFAPTFRGQPVQPVPESRGAPDLLGYYHAPGADHPTLLSSADNGASWRIRPNPPTSLFTQQILETPDGAIFAWMTPASNATSATSAPSGQSHAPGVYALAPGAGTWRLVAPEQVSQTIAIVAFSCDAHSHAQAIWGQDLSQVGVAQPAVLVHWL